MAEVVKNETGWDHAARNKPIDPRVKEGVSVPGMAAQAPPAKAPAATSTAPATPSAPAPQPASPAPVPTSSPPVAPPLSMLDRLKAALAKGEKELEAELTDLMEGQK